MTLGLFGRSGRLGGLCFSAEWEALKPWRDAVQFAAVVGHVTGNGEVVLWLRSAKECVLYGDNGKPKPCKMLTKKTPPKNRRLLRQSWS